MFVLMAGGCGGGGGSGGDGSPDDNEVEGSPVVVVVPEENVFLNEDAELNPNIFHITEIVAYYFANEDDADGTHPPSQIVLRGTDYEVGDVLVLPSSPLWEHGFSVVIESVTRNQNGTETYNLRAAEITDILLDGQFFFTTGATPGEFVTGYPPAYGAVFRASSSVAFEDILDVWREEDWDTGDRLDLLAGRTISFQAGTNRIITGGRTFSLSSLKSSVEAGANMNFDLNLRYDVGFGFIFERRRILGIQAIGAFFPFSDTFEASVTASGFINIPEFEVPVGRLRLGSFVVLVSGIPVHFAAEARVTGIAGLRAEVNFPRYTFSTPHVGSNGFLWERRRGFSRIQQPRTRRNENRSEVQGSTRVHGNFHVGAKIDLVTLMYGVDLLSVNVDPLAFRVEGSYSPGNSDWWVEGNLTWDLKGRANIIQLATKHLPDWVPTPTYEITFHSGERNLFRLPDGHPLIGTWRNLRASFDGVNAPLLTPNSFLRITDVQPQGDGLYRVTASTDRQGFFIGTTWDTWMGDGWQTFYPERWLEAEPPTTFLMRHNVTTGDFEAVYWLGYRLRLENENNRLVEISSWNTYVTGIPIKTLRVEYGRVE